MTPVRLEPAALRSGIKHSTIEPLRSLSSRCRGLVCNMWLRYFLVIGGAVVKFEHVLSALHRALVSNDFFRIKKLVV